MPSNRNACRSANQNAAPNANGVRVRIVVPFCLLVVSEPIGACDGLIVLRAWFGNQTTVGVSCGLCVRLS